MSQLTLSSLIYNKCILMPDPVGDGIMPDKVEDISYFDLGYYFLLNTVGEYTLEDIAFLQYKLYLIFLKFKKNKRHSDSTRLYARTQAIKFIEKFRFLYESQNILMDKNVKINNSFDSYLSRISVSDFVDFSYLNDDKKLTIVIFSKNPSVPYHRLYFSYIYYSDYFDVEKIILAIPNQNTYSFEYLGDHHFATYEIPVNDEFTRRGSQFKQMVIPNTPNYLICDTCSHTTCSERLL